MPERENILIVGVGPGLSSSLARLAAREGMGVALAARSAKKLGPLVQETGARAYDCDAQKPADVDRLFDTATREVGPFDLVVYNPSYRIRGPIAELDRDETLKTLMISCYGGFLVGQRAARQMLERGRGTIVFTGASAGVKGYAQSAPFAMGKFGLRGLAQSMARELHPKNIHVAHVVVDGGITRRADDPRGVIDRGPDGTLDPDEIARTYLFLHRQARNAWSWEIEVRPWVETF
ncbi:MAG: SDR family NAD(P)-dependent oxidoreductase [Alphaproteobacteria bacterium]|nr:SDR family NAD(P)-dependent oxidoreductase [Alphaproteobacteria bacterium]